MWITKQDITLKMKSDKSWWHNYNMSISKTVYTIYKYLFPRQFTQFINIFHDDKY